MIGKWLFNIACILWIFISSLCLLMSIVDEFPAICILLYSLVLCLWIPKFNYLLIKNFFKNNKFLYFILALILSLSLISISMHISENKKITYDTTQHTEINKKSSEDLTWFAKFQCEKEIKARIPSAKVHFRQDNYINGNSYTVYGTIDGQNAFGAMVRQNFGCEIIIDQENDKFWIKDLLIE